MNAKGLIVSSFEFNGISKTSSFSQKAKASVFISVTLGGRENLLTLVNDIILSLMTASFDFESKLIVFKK